MDVKWTDCWCAGAFGYAKLRGKRCLREEIACNGIYFQVYVFFGIGVAFGLKKLEKTQSK